eukprot:572273-Amphidinium_carterae.2
MLLVLGTKEGKLLAMAIPLAQLGVETRQFGITSYTCLGTRHSGHTHTHTHTRKQPLRQPSVIGG